jgi:hypothetical protein
VASPRPRRVEVGPGLEPPEACPRCRRDSCAGDCGARQLVVERAQDFLAAAATSETWLIPDLVADRGLTMFHGRPRSLKSLSALALAIAAALHRPVFGTPRSTAPAALRSVYMTEEDSRNIVAARLTWLLAGFNVSAPETLWLSARKGLTLEAPESQAQILDVVHTLSAELLIFDTGRAFAPSVDKGPSDAAVPIRFLRALLTDTCLRGLVIVHHDTKPARDQRDERTRAERASGGSLLAAVDCPIGFERLSDREALVVPDHYKVSADPPRFRLTFESATPAGESFRDWLRVAATPTTEEDALSDSARGKLRAFIAEHPWAATGDVATGAKVRIQDCTRLLAQLEEAGTIESITGDKAVTRGRSRKAVLWALSGTSV